MNPADAEEYTEALGQHLGASWRQIQLGDRLGVPQALGLSTREWVKQRLGGLPVDHPDNRLADSNPRKRSTAIRQCRCPLWLQAWKPDKPEWCVRCGGLLDPKTLGARK
jgi:hypothetical protein